MKAMLSALVAVAMIGHGGPQPRPHGLTNDDPFGALEFPEAWGKQFWAEPAARKLLELSPKAVADLVPVQAGLRYCRCPACGAAERDEPLTWTLEQPTVLKCRRCGVVVPNDKYPSKPKDKDKVSEESVEVLPGILHHYPYHAVEESEARYPDERLYLKARIDYEARKYLARAALHAAIRWRGGGRDADPRLATLACVILLRFAQVYPAYAVHHDQPDRPKTLQPARLLPPYQRGYQTAKWEWSGSLEVPLNLVMAHALVRGSPGWDVAGKLLGDAAPARTVERDLFRAAAEFARNQPREVSVEGLAAERGILAVARLLDDRDLSAVCRRRLDEFTRQGFYHDGFWREAEAGAHRRVLGLLDGWVAAELARSDPSATRPVEAVALRGVAGGPLPILALAKQAEAALGPWDPAEQVRRASLASRRLPEARRRPVLFGGAGIARLVMGEGPTAFEVELLGQDSYGKARFHRLALRVAVGGSPVIDDLEARGGTGTGWELSTPSHNLVVVDGLNQRETPSLASQPSAGSNILYFAAEPDFQVVSMGDPRAYPQSTTRYRQTIVLSGGPRSRYALAVFEAHGGLQHDQLFHAAFRHGGQWSLSEAAVPAPPSLLPPTIRFLPSAPLEQGRWFVQAYGEFHPEAMARLTHPALATLGRPSPAINPVALAGARGSFNPTPAPEVRLHLLGDTPATVFTALSPEPGDPGPSASSVRPAGRASLILRRRSEQGETLRSAFVTVIEPAGSEFSSLRRVGRVESAPDVVVVMVETGEGVEHLLVNLEPGSTRRVQLASGRYVSFDGLALRVREKSLTLAGGTFAEGSGRLASTTVLAGTITSAVRQPSHRGPGWFVTGTELVPSPELAGKALIVEHGDGTRRAWTLDSVEPIPEGSRLHVREDPGFQVDPRDGSARYEQFPRIAVPGPHRFRVDRMVR